MNKIEEIFTYKSNLLKIGNYCLGVGAVSLIIGLLTMDSFSPAALFVGLGIGGIGMSFMFYILYAVYYFTFQSKIKKYDQKYGLNNIKSEMLGPDALQSKTAYFTRNYIVSPNNGNIFICRYDELQWIYKMDSRQNGITIAIRIVGYIKDSRTLQYIIINSDDNTIMQIFNLIHTKNPNVLIGFTKENNDAYHRLKNQ